MIETSIETPEDCSFVRAANEQVFGRPAEANIVDKLRNTCPDSLSLVAELDRRLVGHILFTPVVIGGSTHTVEGMGLAPMAVLPSCQRQGVGSALIRGGLDCLRQIKCPFVIVLGHPDYYPRFGFEPASRREVFCQWQDVPDEAFMIMVFEEAAMQGVTGVARYRREFSEAL